MVEIGKFETEYRLFLSTLASKALIFINAYKGNGNKRLLSLSDGSTAIDYDDSYIIVNTVDEPYLRDKRDQKIFDKGGMTLEELHDEDRYLLDFWELIDICKFADSLTI